MTSFRFESEAARDRASEILGSVRQAPRTPTGKTFRFGLGLKFPIAANTEG